MLTDYGEALTYSRFWNRAKNTGHGKNAILYTQKTEQEIIFCLGRILSTSWKQNSEQFPRSRRKKLRGGQDFKLIIKIKSRYMNWIMKYNMMNGSYMHNSVLPFI